MTVTRWVSLSVLMEHFSIARPAVKNLIDKGWLDPGVHFVRLSNGKNSAYRFDLDATEKRLRQLAQMENPATRKAR